MYTEAHPAAGSCTPRHQGIEFKWRWIGGTGTQPGTDPSLLQHCKHGQRSGVLCGGTDGLKETLVRDRAKHYVQF